MKSHPLEVKLLHDPLGAFDQFNEAHVLSIVNENLRVLGQIAEWRDKIDNYFDAQGQSHMVREYMGIMSFLHLSEGKANKNKYLHSAYHRSNS